jgi:hypothetical protein
MSMLCEICVFLVLATAYTSQNLAGPNTDDDGEDVIMFGTWNNETGMVFLIVEVDAHSGLTSFQHPVEKKPPPLLVHVPPPMESAVARDDQHIPVLLNHQ